MSEKAMSNTNECLLTQNYDILHEILGLLPAKQLCSLACVSKYLREVSESPYFWKRLLINLHKEGEWSHVSQFFVRNHKMTYLAWRTSHTYVWGLTGNSRLGMELDQKRQTVPLRLTTETTFKKCEPSHEYGGCAVDIDSCGWAWGSIYKEDKPVRIDIGKDTYNVKKVAMGHNVLALVTLTGDAYYWHGDGWKDVRAEHDKYKGEKFVSCCCTAFCSVFLTETNKVISLNLWAHKEDVVSEMPKDDPGVHLAQNYDEPLILTKNGVLYCKDRKFAEQGITQMSGSSGHFGYVTKDRTLFFTGQNGMGQCGVISTEFVDEPMICQHFTNNVLKVTCGAEWHGGAGTTVLTTDHKIYNFGWCPDGVNKTPKLQEEFVDRYVLDVTRGEDYITAIVTSIPRNVLGPCRPYN